MVSCSGIGTRSIIKLLKKIAGVREWHASLFLEVSLWERAFTAPRSILETVWSTTQVDCFISHRSQWKETTFFKKLAEQKVSLCTILDATYPSPLRQLAEPPLILYMQGTYRLELLQLNRTLAIVGTRRISAYGTQVTDYLSKELTRAGATIISGLAAGVDAQAHRSCLEAGGYTVAVLGTAIDTIYPAKNLRLYQQILSGGGCIISEYAPGTPPQKGMFVQRNRIIAGLSRAVIITEAADKSGSLITAGEALELGRDVCAVPGSIFSSGSSGVHHLLQNGAKLINSSNELVEEYQLKPVLEKSDTKGQLNAIEQLILDTLSAQLLRSDQLAEQLSVPVHELQAAITSLEIQARIQRHTDGTLLRIY